MRGEEERNFASTIAVDKGIRDTEKHGHSTTRR